MGDDDVGADALEAVHAADEADAGNGRVRVAERDGDHRPGLRARTDLAPLRPSRTLSPRV